MPESEERELEYSSAMRIFGGLSWGTLISLTLASGLIVIPQVPRPWLWVIPPVWLALVAIGISLQWQIARGHCPKCGTAVIVPTTGLRCPNCRTYLKAVNREVRRMK